MIVHGPLLLTLDYSITAVIMICFVLQCDYFSFLLSFHHHLFIERHNWKWVSLLQTVSQVLVVFKSSAFWIVILSSSIIWTIIIWLKCSLMPAARYTLKYRIQSRNIMMIIIGLCLALYSPSKNVDKTFLYNLLNCHKCYT